MGAGFWGFEPRTCAGQGGLTRELSHRPRCPLVVSSRALVVKSVGAPRAGDSGTVNGLAPRRIGGSGGPLGGAWG